MALVAVLSARSATDAAGATGVVPGVARRGELGFAGQTLIEYQARQAVRAGAATVAILVDEVSPLLTGAIDRLGDDGIHATLVRDLPALGRMVALTDTFLLLADGHVIPNGDLRLLTDAGEPALLVLPATPATQAFERIDAQDVWAGALKAPAGNLLSIVDMLGDWDLALTLMRQVVQGGARRIASDVGNVLDGHLAIVSNSAAASAATQSLAMSGEIAREAVEGDLDDWPVGKPAAHITPFVVRYEINPSVLRLGSIALAVLGLLALLDGYATVGLLLCFGAMIGDRVAAQLDRLLRLALSTRPTVHAVRLVVLMAIVAAGFISGGGSALAAAGGVVTVGLLALAPMLRQRGLGTAIPPSFIFAPGVALLLLAAGALLGMLGAACAICALVAFASHAFQLLGISERTDKSA